MMLRVEGVKEGLCPQKRLDMCVHMCACMYACVSVHMCMHLCVHVCVLLCVAGKDRQAAEIYLQTSRRRETFFPDSRLRLQEKGGYRACYFVSLFLFSELVRTQPQDFKLFWKPQKRFHP